MSDLIDLADIMQRRALEQESAATSSDASLALHIAARATHALELLARIAHPASRPRPPARDRTCPFGCGSRIHTGFGCHEAAQRIMTPLLAALGAPVDGGLQVLVDAAAKEIASLNAACTTAVLEREAALACLRTLVPLPADLVTLLRAHPKRWNEVRALLEVGAHGAAYASASPAHPHADVDSSGGESTKGGAR